MTPADNKGPRFALLDRTATGVRPPERVQRPEYAEITAPGYKSHHLLSSGGQREAGLDTTEGCGP